MPGIVPPVADEREGLLAFLAQQRYVLKLSAYGLTDEHARTAPGPGTLTVGGLIKHVTQMERQWIDLALQRGEQPEAEAGFARYASGFRMEESETLAEILADYDRAASETAAGLVGVDLGRPVPVPKDRPWFPQNVEAWSVRWVLLHVIEETARHAGHADIIRESIDGAGAFPLMAGAEGWPETDWMKPWKPEGV